jgi:hypothetical protein
MQQRRQQMQQLQQMRSLEEGAPLYKKNKNQFCGTGSSAVTALRWREWQDLRTFDAGEERSTDLWQTIIRFCQAVQADAFIALFSRSALSLAAGQTIQCSHVEMPCSFAEGVLSASGKSGQGSVYKIEQLGQLLVVKLYDRQYDAAPFCSAILLCPLILSTFTGPTPQYVAAKPEIRSALSGGKSTTSTIVRHSIKNKLLGAVRGRCRVLSGLRTRADWDGGRALLCCALLLPRIMRSSN